jgi:hypothetical protein
MGLQPVRAFAAEIVLHRWARPVRCCGINWKKESVRMDRLFFCFVTLLLPKVSGICYNFIIKEGYAMTFEELKQKMDEAHYIYDETLATVLYVALQLGRPLLIEGAAGVGKTEIAIGKKVCKSGRPKKYLWKFYTTLAYIITNI